jgi:ribonucleoside-diphosphate reductase alpha subunit
MIRIVKRSGNVETLDITKIQKYTCEAVEGLQRVSQSELEVDANLQFQDMMSSADIQQTLIKTAVDKIDIDRPDWTFVASRLFIYDIYHKVGRNVGGIKGTPYFHLSKYFKRGEKEGRILLGLKEKYDLDDLNNYLVPDRDLQFNYLGIRTLYDRYLLKDKEGVPIELPQQLFMGVAMFLAQNEFDCQTWAKKFYDILSKFEVMAATPTLSNARTPRHQLSSCYIGSTPDNIEGIFDAYKEMALLSKFGGGIGWDWSQVRGMGSYIDGHKHAAGGIVPFLKIANDVAIAVDQLGCVAKNSFVRVLKSVKTDKFTHDFRKEYKEHSLNRDEIVDIISLHIKNFAFKYGKLNQEDIYDLLKDYISNFSLLEICNKFDLSRDQYKKIIGQYKKMNKGVPQGFVIIKDENYAIHKSGVVINLISLKSLGTTIDRKGYVRVALGKKSTPLHKLLVESFFNLPKDEKFTIDHIDNNKLNNSLDNFDILSNEKNISKGWIETKEKRTEMSRIRKHLSHNFRLKGDKRNTEEINILDISTKTIPISKVRIGDLVESFNIVLDKVQYKKVQAVHELEVKKENQIKISFKEGYIITSKWHPMAIKGANGYYYKRSDEIEIGEYGVNHKGKEDKILSIDTNPNISEEYMDLTVEGTNNYFASTDKSDNFYLTHNTRKGAIAVYVEPWHIDIRDFLDLKKNSGEERRRAHDLFPALWLNDLFMQRVQEDARWTLFDPYEVRELTNLYGKEFEERYLELESGTQDISRETISAKGLWKEILRSYFETGNPFLTFKDTANKSNPNKHSGIIRSSNLCTEIFQNTSPNHYKIQLTFNDGTVQVLEEDEEVSVDNGMTKPAKKITALDSLNGKQIWMVDKEKTDGETAVCNLASINLSKINTTEDIERVVPIAIRMLDNVIDLNFYPLAKVKKTNEKTRAIGLGVMGEAQMLAESKVEWGSNEHFFKIDEIMESVSYYAIRSSSDLAIEKGVYATYEGSEWSKGIFPIDNANEEACKLVERGGLFGYTHDWLALKEKVKNDGMRNGYLMAVAPTSSISILTGTTQAIEPVYKRKWFEENLSGLIPVVAPNLSANTWSYYTPAYDLNQNVLIKAGAIRQKWIDQGQSLNIFITLDKASGKYLNEIYMNAWKFGLKSTYYLRSQSPEASNDIEDRSQECVGCQ